MKKISILFLILSFVVWLPFALTEAKKTTNKKQSVVRSQKKTHDIAQTIDSIHWLIERHCDNKTESMGRDDGTIEQIKRKFRTLPVNSADSLLSAQYDRIVTLFEEERNNRAFALTDCYYALAKGSDPNLGSLYLNDMVLAIERNDSILLRTRMNELKAYANRNNLDYDQDLEDGEINMRNLRQRIAFKTIPFDDLLLENGNSVLWVLDNDYCHSNGGIPFEFMPYISPYMFLGNGDRIYCMNLSQVKKDKTEVYCYLNGMHSWGYNNIIKDNENKHYFASYSTEKGGTTNPKLLASGRQLVQNLHASVSGELARKKYSYGTRLAGEVVTTLVDVGLNALFDYLSVTTQHAYSSSLNLTMTAPNIIEGELHLVHAAVRSDNPGNPKVTQTTIPLRYYKTFPEEDLHFINDKNDPVYRPTMNRSTFEKEKAKYKIKAKVWKARQSDWKKTNKGKKPKYNKYYEFHNDSVLNILRERAESSFEKIEI